MLATRRSKTNPRYTSHLMGPARPDASLRSEQVLRERPLLVDPLCLAAKTGVACHLEDFLRRILVATFRPDSLALQKFDPKVRRRDAYHLPPHGPQVHLDAARLVIDPCHVGELPKVKVGIEFAIDAGQQVEIECRRHSEFRSDRRCISTLRAS